MRLLVLDTETTGLPLKKKASIYEKEQWPYVIQLSYILFNTETNKIEETFDKIIKLDENIEITEKSISMHKITKELSQSNGIDICYALQKLNSILSKTDMLIGHNISFDKQILIVENIRNKMVSNFPKVKTFCTMKNYKDFCAIIQKREDGSTYMKYPTLCELHEKLFDTQPDNLHNSYIDVLICLKCYLKKEFPYETFYETINTT